MMRQPHPPPPFHVLGNRGWHDPKRWTLNLPIPTRAFFCHPHVPRAQIGTKVASAPMGARNGRRWQLFTARDVPVSVGTRRSGVGELLLRTFGGLKVLSNLSRFAPPIGWFTFASWLNLRSCTVLLSGGCLKVLFILIHCDVM